MKQNNNNNLKAKKAFKVVLLGDSSCGKTSLLSRYIKNIFSEEYTPTVFDSSSTEILMGKVGDLKIDIWDTSGSSEFDHVRPLSYEGVSLFLACFDLNDSHSFENLSTKWAEEIRSHKTVVPIIMVGCKSDLCRDTIKDRQKYLHAARSINALAYFESSSKLGERRKDIERMFDIIALVATGQINKIPKDYRVSNQKSKDIKCTIL